MIGETLDFPTQLAPVHTVDLPIYQGIRKEPGYTGRVGWLSTSTLGAWNSIHLYEVRENDSDAETELKFTSYVKCFSTFFGRGGVGWLKSA